MVTHRYGRLMRSPSQLRKLSGHVLYELQVLFGTAEVLQHQVLSTESDPDWLTQMVYLEAFLVHARGLDHFLFRDRASDHARNDDGLAEDFFDPGRWKEICPDKEKTLDRLSSRVGKEIAHVTYTRTTVTEDAKGWQFAQIASSIGRPFRVFIDNVEQERVIPDFSEKVRATFPPYLRQPAAISYPPDSWPPSAATGMNPSP